MPRKGMKMQVTEASASAAVSGTGASCGVSATSQLVGDSYAPGGSGSGSQILVQSEVLTTESAGQAESQERTTSQSGRDKGVAEQ